MARGHITPARSIVLACSVFLFASAPALAGHPGYGHPGCGYPYHHHYYYGGSFSLGIGIYGGPGYYGGPYVGYAGPLYYPYDLDDRHPGYYGGGRYTEYYANGRAGSAVGIGAVVPLNRDPVPPPVVASPGGLPVPGTPGGAAGTTVSRLPNTARLIIELAPDAELWLEGAKTSQTGPTRTFVTPALVPGEQYEYTVKARWVDEGGRPVEKEQAVKVFAGAQVRITFPVGIQPPTLPAPRRLDPAAVDETEK